MDYKELVENLKEWHRTIWEMCGDNILTCDDLCGCTGDCIVVQAITAITDLLTENQALRNAANGFKKQLEAAEARAEKAERERDAAIKQLKCAYDAIDKLSNMIDSRIHPNVDCYRYMSRMENLDAILAWDAKSNGVD